MRSLLIAFVAIALTGCFKDERISKDTSRAPGRNHDDSGARLTLEAYPSERLPATGGVIKTKVEPLPLWVVNACSQRAIVGENHFGNGVENLCKNWHKNSFDANMGQLLAEIFDPNEGIDSQVPGYGRKVDREYMRFVILCGLGPSYPLILGYNCSAQASQLGIADASLLPEWKIYERFLRPHVTEPRSKFEQSYIHGLTAEQIMRFRLLPLAGCTGAAKVFAHLVRSLGFHARYVATFRVNDYRSACGCQGNVSCLGRMRSSGITINGHQVVAIVYPETGKWRLLNTSVGYTLAWAKDFYTKAIIEVDAPEQLTKRYVDFGALDENTQQPIRFMVSAVEYDLAYFHMAIDSHDGLMNVYSSGNSADASCKFDPAL